MTILTTDGTTDEPTAERTIRAGDARCVLCGGTESMSNAPYLLDRARTGYKLFHGHVVADPKLGRVVVVAGEAPDKAGRALGQCIDAVVERSGWKNKHRQLPFGRGVGIACSSYISGAGLPIYWNSMPHSGVVVRADRSGSVTVLCGATDIGQGSDSILAYIVAEVLGVDPFEIHVVTADTFGKARAGLAGPSWRPVAAAHPWLNRTSGIGAMRRMR